MAAILASITTEEYMEMLPIGIRLITRKGNEKCTYKGAGKALLSEGNELKLYKFDDGGPIIQLASAAVYEHFALDVIIIDLLKKSLFTLSDEEKQFLINHHNYLMRKLQDGTSEE